MKVAMTDSQVSLVKRLTELSVVSFVYFVAIIAVLHILRPDYNPLSRTVSEYALGVYGPLMTSSFVVLGLGSILLVAAMIRGIPATGLSRGGIVLLALWGLGVFVLSIFPTDKYGIPVSTTGIIHSLTALVALLFLVIASLLCTLRFRRDSSWKSFLRPSLVLTILMFTSLVIFLASPVALKGITERILLLVAVVWLSGIALRLRSLYSAV